MKLPNTLEFEDTHSHTTRGIQQYDLFVGFMWNIQQISSKICPLTQKFKVLGFIAHYVFVVHTYYDIMRLRVNMLINTQCSISKQRNGNKTKIWTMNLAKEQVYYSKQIGEHSDETLFASQGIWHLPANDQCGALLLSDFMGGLFSMQLKVVDKHLLNNFKKNISKLDRKMKNSQRPKIKVKQEPQK